jgi:ABC-type transport system involved in multi-copper enzyme maturation permease subunit
MIWLTWRQFRAQAWAALATLAVLGIAFAITGPHLASLYDSSGIPTCQAHGDCGTLASNFMAELSKADVVLYFLGVAALYVMPAVIGIFWGAPLVTRELEADTLKLTWNQSVTRTRWIAVKLGLIGLASMAAAGLFSLMMAWWASPINQANGLNASRNGSSSLNRLSPLLFGASGIAPLGYAAFAFILGVTAGVLIRRTLPAMAVTLAVFAAIQVVMPNAVRPHLIAPRHITVALSSAAIDELSVRQNGHITVVGAVNIPGAWILSNQTITAAGRAYTGPAPQSCQTPNFQACQASLARLHLRHTVTYQPASRYWAFQWYETAIFLAAALVLAGFCVWWIRRRRLS